MVVAQHTAEAGEGVVLESAGLLVLAQGAQRATEEAGDAQCVGVVLAEDSAVAADGVALQLPGLLVLAQR
jgi:hypothetical protein